MLFYKLQKMPTTTYKYHLEKYAGRSTRHKCPACGRVQSFSFYVDENNRPAGPEYGRCNHSGCGYILYPSGIAAPSPDVPTHTAPPPPPIYYTKDEVKRYRAAEMDNALSRFLSQRFFDMDRLKSVFRDYCIGSVEDGIIFWQIDENCQIHRGKVMWYKDNGHRLKLTRPDGSEYGKVQMMWKYLNHDRDREPEMCYFGQHLAALHPDKPIAIVESEKTALVMSYLYPDFIWVATLSLNNFQAYRLNFLQGSTRKVIVFPDADGMALWKEKAAAISNLMPSLQISVNPFTLLFGDGKDDLADIVFDGFFSWTTSFIDRFKEYINETY